MTIDNFPCDNCICVAVCRHKRYSSTLEDCSLIRHYINKYASIADGNLYITVDSINNQLTHFRSMLQDHLHPTMWKVNEIGMFITYIKELNNHDY